MWAGYLPLVKQQEVANGKPPLGSINPALYTIGSGASYNTAFHDITTGSNGYSAATGYDLATDGAVRMDSGLLNALVGGSSFRFTRSASPTSVTVAQGGSGASTITSTVTGSFNGVLPCLRQASHRA